MTAPSEPTVPSGPTASSEATASSGPTGSRVTLARTGQGAQPVTTDRRGMTDRRGTTVRHAAFGRIATTGRIATVSAPTRRRADVHGTSAAARTSGVSRSNGTRAITRGTTGTRANAAIPAREMVVLASRGAVANARGAGNAARRAPADPRDVSAQGRATPRHQAEGGRTARFVRRFPVGATVPASGASPVREGISDRSRDYAADRGRFRHVNLRTRYA